MKYKGGNMLNTPGTLIAEWDEEQIAFFQGHGWMCLHVEVRSLGGLGRLGTAAAFTSWRPIPERTVQYLINTCKPTERGNVFHS
jgi:hypothetical protein